MPDASYVRFQGTVRNEQGVFPGVFGLVNRLARAGRLSSEQYRFWRANNDWYDTNYPNPSDIDPLVYDHETHPGAVAWFKASSQELITRVDGYLELLAAHGVECQRVESSEPGKIIYEDEYQVVVIPHELHETSTTGDLRSD
ncbi:hypothetical protein ACFPH6_45645 [Streptomyces xiangluensis]|uniref:GyrI-like small molecule binding domain-containing protein n=1 Tax=Streptomyces xiangluensis TaxID=2665720 RepID=A0ABV8Z2J6_9ACTN